MGGSNILATKYFDGTIPNPNLTLEQLNIMIFEILWRMM
jgi:hypothetical protein